MNFIFILPVIVIILMSSLIVKIASVALSLTGLDPKRAFFQALSAFTGTGFTTRDSELVVEHDIRRNIIVMLMILGNAGLVSVITTLMISFMRTGAKPFIANIGIILLIILIFMRVSQDKGITRKFTKKIQEKLIKSAPFKKRLVEEVLCLAEGYGVAEVTLMEACPDIGKLLSESSFRRMDILVLAIERNSKVIPAPHASDRLFLNDILICYGKLANMGTISGNLMRA